jgi:hypothetical protein
MSDNALVFDIETIADLSAENRAAVGALASGRNMTPEAYGGLCPPLARVVCIAWVHVAAGRLAAVVDGTLCAGALDPSILVDSGGAPVACDLVAADGEADVLRRFGRVVEHHLGHADAQLVTYNGRGFDLPVLIHRAIKHGVIEGRERLLQAITESRHRPLLHVDLLDSLTFYGASQRFPMAAYVIGYGWRSPKQEMSGAQVWDAVSAGRIPDIARYCAGDVLATAYLYGRFRDCLMAPSRTPT